MSSSGANLDIVELCEACKHCGLNTEQEEHIAKWQWYCPSSSCQHATGLDIVQSPAVQVLEAFHLYLTEGSGHEFRQAFQCFLLQFLDSIASLHLLLLLKFCTYRILTNIESLALRAHDQGLITVASSTLLSILGHAWLQPRWAPQLLPKGTDLSCFGECLQPLVCSDRTCSAEWILAHLRRAWRPFSRAPWWTRQLDRKDVKEKIYKLCNPSWNIMNHNTHSDNILVNPTIPMDYPSK